LAALLADEKDSLLLISTPMGAVLAHIANVEHVSIRQAAEILLGIAIAQYFSGKITPIRFRAARAAFKKGNNAIPKQSSG